MRTFEDDSLTDFELSEMLAAWTVPDPPPTLRARVFAPKTERFDRQARATTIAFLAEAAIAALLVLAIGSPQLRKPVSDVTAIYLPAYRPHVRATVGAGGGGGSHSTPPMRGQAPRFAAKQSTPPALAVLQPKLAVTPTITAAAPQIDAQNYGDPLSGAIAGGFGVGSGSGVGPGNGGGYGPGLGGGSGGGVYRIGGDIAAPVLVSKVEPEYSEEARKAKYSGEVLLSVLIDAQGIPRDIKVVRPLGMGLDEKAIQAVSKWRFRPAMKGGQPVSVTATVDVSFRLL